MFMSNKQGNNVKLSVWALCCRSLGGTRLRSYGSQLSYTPMFPETLDFAGFLSYSIF